MSTWDALQRELDAWSETGRDAAFWWRDDDAVMPTPALDRLIDLARRSAAPVHLAVIPAKLDPDLAPYLRGTSLVYVLQHALAHTNHEPRSHRASELGPHRPLDAQRADLQSGWEILQTADLPRLLPVLVPPWNRIAPTTVPHLPQMGYAALSTFDARMADRGVLEINAHLDPIRWKEGAQFRGEARLLAQLCDRLHATRTGMVDACEPTGILTHHLQTDAATWGFMDRLFDHLSAHPAVRWRALADYLPGAQPHE